MNTLQLLSKSNPSHLGFRIFTTAAALIILSGCYTQVGTKGDYWGYTGKVKPESAQTQTASAEPQAEQVPQAEQAATQPEPQAAPEQTSLEPKQDIRPDESQASTVINNYYYESYPQFDYWSQRPTVVIAIGNDPWSPWYRYDPVYQPYFVQPYDYRSRWFGSRYDYAWGWPYAAYDPWCSGYSSYGYYDPLYTYGPLYGCLPRSYGFGYGSGYGFGYPGYYGNPGYYGWGQYGGYHSYGQVENGPNVKHGRIPGEERASGSQGLRAGSNEAKRLAEENRRAGRIGNVPISATPGILTTTDVATMWDKLDAKSKNGKARSNLMPTATIDASGIPVTAAAGTKIDNARAGAVSARELGVATASTNVDASSAAHTNSSAAAQSKLNAPTTGVSTISDPAITARRQPEARPIDRSMPVERVLSPNENSVKASSGASQTSTQSDGRTTSSTVSRPSSSQSGRSNTAWQPANPRGPSSSNTSSNTSTSRPSGRSTSTWSAPRRPNESSASTPTPSAGRSSSVGSWGSSSSGGSSSGRSSSAPSGRAPAPSGRSAR